MTKVSRKLNILLILSVSISVLISSMLIVFFMTGQIEKDRLEKDMINLDGMARSIEAYLENAATLNYQLSINGEVADSIESADSDWERRVETYSNSYNLWRRNSTESGPPLLTSTQLKYDFVELLHIQDSRGYQTGRSFGAIGRRDNRWWFRAMIGHMDYQPFISHSYFSVTGYKPVASIFHPVWRDGAFLGIMGMDINFHKLRDFMEAYMLSDNLYAIITDMNGVIIAHPDDEKIDQMYNLISMTRSTLCEDKPGSINSSGYLVSDKVPLQWNPEISRAAAAAVAGRRGHLSNISIEGKSCNLYYAPVPLNLEGNAGENYAVLLVQSRSDIVHARVAVLLSVALFVFVTILILYPVFRRLFKRNIGDPLNTLISSMSHADIDNFNEIRIDTGDEFALLASTYNNLNKNLLSANRQLREKLEYLKESEEGYKAFSEIGLALSSEKNAYVLLGLILDRAMEQTRADGGTIYLYDSLERKLDFKIIHTESMNFHMGGSSGNPVTFPPVPLYRDGKPNYANVSSYSALTGEVVNIPDVYSAVGFDFQGTRDYDKRNGYRSKSMLVIPMKNMENELIGVIQLINARKKDSDSLIPFSEMNQNLSISLASQAAVALTNVQLNEELKNLFNSFIRSIATAVDEKSPFTSGHIDRVVLLTMMIAGEINKAETGVFAETVFTENELEELRLSAWMHDIGKITTPEGLIGKETKLQGVHDGIDILEARYKMIQSVRETSPAPRTDDEGNDLTDEMEFLRSCNQSVEFLSDEKLERLNRIFGRRYYMGGEKYPYLTDEEYYNLSIRKGNLNREERKAIEHHARVTKRILSELPFPKHLSRVVDFASMHHEKLDGSGYPDGLTAEKIPLQARIIAVSDIFEALTAKDRPYREPMKLSKAMAIMNQMVSDGHIDGDLVRFLVDRELVNRYAETELSAEQIDIV